MLYRSEDGTCNNLKHSLWGRANVALTRLLAPDYEDGKYQYFTFFFASDTVGPLEGEGENKFVYMLRGM